MVCQASLVHLQDVILLSLCLKFEPKFQEAYLLPAVDGPSDHFWILRVPLKDPMDPFVAKWPVYRGWLWWK